MLSIIVCSINQTKLEEFKKNVAETIGEGVKFEVIAHSNLHNPVSISKAYNECASKAQYPYLLFSHEDVGFITENWFEKIHPQLKEDTCGVIGFAGSKVVYDIPGSWFADPKWVSVNYIQTGVYMHANSGPDKPWTQVIALDGLAMFVRKNVWEQNKFDEKNLTGFHCYDMDFSMSLAKNFKNYVCGGVLVCHESHGNYNKAWINDTIRMYKSKWHEMLPMMTPDVNLDSKTMASSSERAYFRIIKRVSKKNIIPMRLLTGYSKYPISSRHFEHWMKIAYYQTRALFRSIAP